MTRAVDPFEEFLRKKKVEMLEEKVRKGSESEPAKSAEPEEEQPVDTWAPFDNPDEEAVDRRLDDEMTDFFARSAGAGAELFAQAQEIDEEQVDEIKDALEDVFEAESSAPEVVEQDDDTFIDFFKEVQTSFDPDLADLRREQDLAREVVQPPAEGTFEDEPLTAEFPVPEAKPAEEPAFTDEPEPEPEEAGQPEPVVKDPLRLEPEQASAVDNASLVLDDEATGQEPTNSAERLELAEILGPMQEGEDVRRRVDVLSRLVVKLVERSDLSESELIEVLIKSGVGF